MSTLPAIAVLIVAAGRGSRLGGDVPKQYRALNGKPVLAQTLAAAACSPLVERIHTLIHPDDRALYEAAAYASGVDIQRLSVGAGGASRQESVRLGLEALAASAFPMDGIVLIHDAARPFLSETMLLRIITGVARHGSVIPVLPVADTLATLDGAGVLNGNPNRAALRAVQTPQGFRFAAILDAHRQAHAEHRADFTDDASLASAYGNAVHTVAGDPALFKITVEADLARAEAMLGGHRETRTGIGYDVHAFSEGDHVILGGVRIAHEKSLLGHSDADPVLHAITDALLGTIGDGDIGQHFPPSDEKWRGAASHLFLEDAARRVREKGGRIVNIDVTIVCEMPKIGPHRAAIQAVIGHCLGLSMECVGVKATTSERLGFTGRKEGIAAIATANVEFIRTA